MEIQERKSVFVLRKGGDCGENQLIANHRRPTGTPGPVSEMTVRERSHVSSDH